MFYGLVLKLEVIYWIVLVGMSVGFRLVFGFAIDNVDE